MIRLLPLLLFPIAELWLLLELGDVLGAWPVIGWCLATVFFGMWLIRRQASALGDFVRNAQNDVRRGIRPTTFEPGGHALWAFAGVLFAFPGVISDVIAVGLITRGFIMRLRRPKPPRQRTYTTSSPNAGSIEVDVLPPGEVQSPFNKRPRVIDVD